MLRRVARRDTDPDGRMDGMTRQEAAAPLALAQEAAPPLAGRIALFGHDSTESTLIKRARAFEQLGLALTGYCFRRDKFNSDVEPFWHNIELGATEDRSYAKRLPRLLLALARLAAQRRRLATADVIYARNLDMFALAVIARGLAGGHAALVYEVLDVQRVLVGERLVNRLFRALERWLLARCDLLVVSSPRFLSAYFRPQQGYRGPSFLLENKIWFDRGKAVPARAERTRARPGPPWVIGWFGTLRCRRSLEILCRAAELLGERVEIYLRGYPTETGLAHFQAAIAPFANMVYEGPYRNPRDLAAIYGRVHFTWAFDFLDQGANSDWLLPNRLYEGGYFGCVALAAAGSQTGETLEARGLGYSLAPPFPEALAGLLAGMTSQTYRRKRAQVLAQPDAAFRDLGDTRRLCVAALELARRDGASHREKA